MTTINPDINKHNNNEPQLNLKKENPPPQAYRKKPCGDGGDRFRTQLHPPMHPGDHYSYYTYNDRLVDKKRAEDTDTPPKYVEVLFKCKRKRIFRNDLHLKLQPSQFVIVELESGVDIGIVCCMGECAENKINSEFCEKPSNSIVRIATEDDLQRDKENIASAEDVLNKSRELIDMFRIDMKVSIAEWQFDHQRLTISFTAPQRVDFRDLVRELARTFRTRIELRQISNREEAKRIGGLGPCGRCICCNSICCDFNHITLDHARIQQLSNNINKLSGYCGRLKCCLMYEHDTYIDAFKDYPPIGSLVEMPEGKAKIIKIDIFKDLTTLHNSYKNQYHTLTKEELLEYDKAGKIQRVKEEINDLKGLNKEELKELMELEKEY